MLKNFPERAVAQILGFGAALTTIIVLIGSVTDPVNTPKLVTIGVIAFASIAIVAKFGIFSIAKRFPIVSSLLLFFNLAMIWATLNSKSPVVQNMYGVYGRNNGLVTYFILSLIMFSVLSISKVENFRILIKGLIFAGLVNVIYCLWVILFGDFVGWVNPYGNILGTLGNPNFIGSFLGIFFVAYLAFGLKSESTTIYRYSMLGVLPITAFEIIKSHAIQGRVVAVAGLVIVGFLYIRSRYSPGILSIYSLSASVLGIFALLGALQIGPLTKFIYKTSVSLRGQYWLAGWNTGESHPLTGVGMDAFGDWYRRSRDLHAIELPGVNTVVNASHNVPLDIFAFGGWPLFVIYILIMLSAGRAAIRIILRKKAFDPIFVVLVTSWSGYQLQSIISINQIGLAIWGWLLSGALVAFEKSSRTEADTDPSRNTKSFKMSSKNGNQPVVVVIGSLGALLGLIIALPPLTADTKWRNAQLAKTSVAIEDSMKPSFFNPQNSTKYLTNIQMLEQSNLFDISHKYALEAVSWNPEAYELWKVLYLIKNSTPAEKALALKNMKRLDPLNPDVTATQ